ncbi:MAG: hypothetical protein Alpg2KO_23880 [Alphaproteobacteria bacterium]
MRNLKLIAAAAAIALVPALALQPAQADMAKATAEMAQPEWVSYTADSLSALKADEKTILVDVSADWCSTCKKQHVILEELRADPALADVTFVRVDFDDDKDFIKANRIPRQSTILIYGGDEELGRSIADSNRDSLREFVMNSVAKAEATN